MRSLKFMKSQQGTSTIEFALIIPILLLVLVGIVEFGIILYNKAVLTNACREGARFGIVSASPRRTEGEIREEVLRCLRVDPDDHDSPYKLISFAEPAPVPDPDPQLPPSPSFGEELVVRVDYDYEFLLLPGFIPGVPQPLPLSAQTVMKYE